MPSAEFFYKLNSFELKCHNQRFFHSLCFFYGQVHLRFSKTLSHIYAPCHLSHSQTLSLLYIFKFYTCVRINSVTQRPHTPSLSQVKPPLFKDKKEKGGERQQWHIFCNKTAPRTCVYICVRECVCVCVCVCDSEVGHFSAQNHSTQVHLFTCVCIEIDKYSHTLLQYHRNIRWHLNSHTIHWDTVHAVYAVCTHTLYRVFISLKWPKKDHRFSSPVFYKLSWYILVFILIIFMFLAWCLHLMSVALSFICSFVFYCEAICDICSWKRGEDDLFFQIRFEGKVIAACKYVHWNFFAVKEALSFMEDRILSGTGQCWLFII